MKFSGIWIPAFAGMTVEETGMTVNSVSWLLAAPTSHILHPSCFNGVLVEAVNLKTCQLENLQTCISVAYSAV